MLTQGLPKTIPLSVRLKNSPAACHYIALNLYFPAVQFAGTFRSKQKEYFTFFSDYTAMPRGS